MYSRRRPDIGLLWHDDSNVERLYTCTAGGGLILGCCGMTTQMWRGYIHVEQEKA